MVFRNLLRRKVRTLLTVLGISVGVACIVGLGALANGIMQGYGAILTGTKADLILGQPDAYDMAISSVDDSLGRQLAAMPEVAAVSGMLEGFVQAESVPYFFLYGYPEDSFVLERFRVTSGEELYPRAPQKWRGKPLLLGASAAEALKKQVGDTLRLTDRVFRVVGIYETGDTLEDNGAVLRLADAQDLLGRPRTVSLYYIQLEQPELRPQLERRIGRLWPDLALNSTGDYADKQLMGDMLQVYVWVIAGLAILIGGVGMMNTQLMAVTERTREIGVLRALGWHKSRVLLLILEESLLVCLVGGLLGIGVSWAFLSTFSTAAGFFGASTADITPALLGQALLVVLVMGLVSGLYPAWRASRLQPVEALRYEGGSSGGGVRRIPLGGMALQSLWQRSARTFLTLSAIGITVGGIMVLESIVRGVVAEMNGISADSEVMIRQANISDTDMSAIDERTGDKIAAYPQVAHVSGLAFTGTFLQNPPAMFIIWGYAPNSYALRQFRILEGASLTSNRQILLGQMMADMLHKSVGEQLELGGNRYTIVGIFQGNGAWQEMGGILTLRDTQTFMGRPHKVSMYLVKLHDPDHAQAVVDQINSELPDAHANKTSEFVEQMPDMKLVDGMITATSLLAILVGGVGVMNAMLMAVFERTREIGVLRALGWGRRSILGTILQEAVWLGILGGMLGTLVAFLLGYLIMSAPLVGGLLTPIWEWDIFARAFLVALVLGLAGGLYPAYRATRLQPVEALRYE